MPKLRDLSRRHLQRVERINPKPKIMDALPKRLIADTTLSSDVNQLIHQAATLCFQQGDSDHEGRRLR
ncbi:hypothetical protein PINS_up012366 [Pythium insidiosum]|nr:hypothetical protein PINS_up012366 [Pythium insidiosum]